jgi:GMP synthase (glutamine-hydrolysing)
VPLREQRPFLGICLGAQMLAKQLGARVALHPEGQTQIGYYPVRPRDSSCRGARRCWPKVTTSRYRLSSGTMRSACSFIPM